MGGWGKRPKVLVNTPVQRLVDARPAPLLGCIPRTNYLIWISPPSAIIFVFQYLFVDCMLTSDIDARRIPGAAA